VHPFDLKTVLLAKHAQHIVLLHFPIAWFIAAVTFDLIMHWTKRRGLAVAAYYNLLAQRFRLCRLSPRVSSPGSSRSREKD
jgi:hypothetical protein